MIKKNITKISESIKTKGIRKTIPKVIQFILRPLKDWLYQRYILKKWSIEEKFLWIYKNNYWKSGESKSGEGSSLIYTSNIQKKLPEIFKTYSIKSIFDGPCGDFNWMSKVLKNCNVSYTGGDIVKPLINDLNEKYSKEKISFIHIDITKDAIPNSDMMICRDCLFHLSFRDTENLILNFLKSNTPYLLTTTFENSDQSIINRDIQTGDFRKIDLCSSPYNLPLRPLAKIDDWVFPHAKRYLYLWSREQVESSLIASHRMMDVKNIK